MEIPINYLAVLVAAVVNFILGYLWFGPVFGKFWMKASGFTKPEVIDANMKKSMMVGYAGTFIGSLLMSYILAHGVIFASAFTGTVGLMAGIGAGLSAWIGFVLPVTVGTVFWDGKSWSYWAVTYLYYLVGLVVMGVILACWI